MRKSGLIATVAVTVACALAAASCSKPSGLQLARRLLFESLREQSRPFRADESFDTARVVITLDTSAVLSGVVYYWGGMPNPRIVDAFLGDLAAAVEGDATILSTFADWRQLAARSGWMPSNPADVLGACREALTTVGPRADPTDRPRILTDTLSSTGTLPQFVVDSILHRNLPLPTIRGDSAAGWIAEFWAVEIGQLTRYRCQLRAWETLAVTPLDSVMHTGYLNLFGPFPRPRRAVHERARR
ncbi:MAG: hypothetical protein P8099_19305 [Gemmatimonadota bacterium]|jgi:hypothetical protein